MNLTETEFYEKWVGTSFNSYMLVWNEWVGTKGTGGDPIMFVTKFSRDVYVCVCKSVLNRRKTNPRSENLVRKHTQI